MMRDPVPCLNNYRGGGTFSEFTARIVIVVSKQAILYKLYARKAKQLYMLARKAIGK